MHLDVTHHWMKINREKYQNYLRDLIYLLKERNEEIKSKKNKDDINIGIEQAYNEVVNVIKNQAEVISNSIRKIWILWL